MKNKILALIKMSLALLSLTGIFGIATIYSVIQRDNERQIDIEDMRREHKHSNEIYRMEMKFIDEKYKIKKEMMKDAEKNTEKTKL